MFPFTRVPFWYPFVAKRKVVSPTEAEGMVLDYVGCDTYVPSNCRGTDVLSNLTEEL